MRISLLLPGFGPLTDSVRQAEMAERSGFDGVWIAEHVGFHDSPVTAALCLARTTHLEVGLMGLAPGRRQPALTAMEIASLGEFAPGRVRVQLGTGETELMKRIGIDPAKPVTRVSAFLRVIRSLLNGETLTADSPVGRLDDFTLSRSGTAFPIPIDVLAIRPKMLELAARNGDGVCMTGGASRDYIRSRLESVRKIRSSCGLVEAPFRTVAVVFAVIADDWGDQLDPLANILSGFSATLAPVLFRGALSEVELEQFKKRAPEERAALFTSDVLRELAIVCRPVEVEKALANWFELGLDEICIFPVGREEHLGPALASMGAVAASFRMQTRSRHSIKEENDSCP